MGACKPVGPDDGRFASEGHRDGAWKGSGNYLHTSQAAPAGFCPSAIPVTLRLPPLGIPCSSYTQPEPSDLYDSQLYEREQRDRRLSSDYHSTGGNEYRGDVWDAVDYDTTVIDFPLSPTLSLSLPSHRSLVAQQPEEACFSQPLSAAQLPISMWSRLLSIMFRVIAANTF